MGTRADFYIGIGACAEWIGSVTHDGDPYFIAFGRLSECVAQHQVLSAKSEDDYRSLVAAMIEKRPGVGVPPEEGWPWWWDDSSKTDWTYAFHAGRVWGATDKTEFRDLSQPATLEYPYISETADRLPYQVPDMSGMSKRADDSGFMILGSF